MGGSVGREAMISAGSEICHLPCGEGWEVSVDVAEGAVVVVALIVDAAAAMSGRRVKRFCR